MKTTYFREFKPKIISVMKRGYSFKNFTSDLVSGFVVAIIALPLSMAFAIASGASPERVYIRQSSVVFSYHCWVEAGTR